MKKYIKFIIFGCFIVVCLLSLIYLYSNDVKQTNIYTSEVLILKDNTEYEIKTNIDKKNTIFRENENEEIILNYPREVKSRLSIPNLDNIEGENVLLDKKPIIDYTYNVSFSNGCKYIKYLVEEGYIVEMFVSNPQFFECFLKNDVNYKRVVLFQDTMMVCDMDLSVELPEVKEYLKNYNYNGFIDKKFGLSEIIKEEE